MARDRYRTAAHAGLLVGVLGALAWLSGQPFVFPSLGPSAFVLATARAGERPSDRTVVGSHFLGALSGVLAYAALGGDVVLVGTFAPGSTAGLALAASGVTAMVLTSLAMFATNTVHPPACATTLIVSLGLLETPVEAAIIVVSVCVLVAVQRGGEWVLGRLRDDGPTGQLTVTDAPERR